MQNVGLLRISQQKLINSIDVRGCRLSCVVHAQGPPLFMLHADVIEVNNPAPKHDHERREMSFG